MNMEDRCHTCHPVPGGCRCAEPYPTLTNMRDNPDVVELLRQDYASAKSELSAIHSYMYQHNLLVGCNTELADLLECIGIVEMDHAMRLADAIIKLGGTPIYAVNKACGCAEYWNAEASERTRLVKEMLHKDIAGERDAIVQYEEHAQVIPIPQVSALLRRIARDEALHVRLLTHALEELDND